MAISSTITCPDCNHDFHVQGVISDDDTLTCDYCKGKITVSLEFEEAEKPEEDEG